MQIRARPTVPACVILLLAGCGGADQGAEPTTPPSTPASTATSQEPSTMPESDPALSGFVDTAVADLAERLDVPESEITVVSAEQVTWGDTSLGCPQPGMRYAQVVQDGTYIELEHDGTTYPYHSGGERPDPFLCEQPPDKGQGDFEGTLTPR